MTRPWSAWLTPTSSSSVLAGSRSSGETAPAIGKPGRSVRVELDPEELSPDEKVIAVAELPFGLQTDVGAVAAIEIGDGKLAGDLVDATVRRRHEKIPGEIE